MVNSHLVLRELSSETLALVLREMLAATLALTLYFVVSMALVDIGILNRYVLFFLFIRMLEVLFEDRLSPMVCAILAFSDDVLNFLYPGLSTALILLYLHVARPLFNRNIQSSVPELVLIVPYAVSAYCLCWSLDYALSSFIHASKIHIVA